MSSRVSLPAVAQELDTLTDEERAALRASRFHSAPAPPPPDRRRRLAHPGGALATNKAAALAKFLKRKLKEDGATSLDPALVERAVQNAKATFRSGTSAVTVVKVRHVDSFSGSDEDQDVEVFDKKPKKGCGTVGAHEKKGKMKVPKLVTEDKQVRVTKKKKKKKKKKSG